MVLVTLVFFENKFVYDNVCGEGDNRHAKAGEHAT